MNLHVDTIMSWEPCDDYPRKRIVELFGGEELDVMSISRLPIPPEGVFWALARTEVLGEKNNRLFACDCAERVAHLGDEPLLRGVIEVARRYVSGEATDEELGRAAKDADIADDVAAAWAAWAAYAAWSSADGAADGAADAAARAAVCAARNAWEGRSVWDAERQWQLDRLRYYLEATND